MNKVKPIALKFSLAIAVLGCLTLSPLALATNNQKRDEAENKREILEDRYIANDVLFYDDEEECNTNQTMLIESGDAEKNLETILRYFTAKGFTLNQACGISGNIQQESFFVPNKIQGGALVDETFDLSTWEKRGLSGFGLVQWTSSGRQDKLVAYAKKTNRHIIDLSLQLDFIMVELLSDYKTSTLVPLSTVSDVREATRIFHNGYERSADTATMIENRADYAESHCQKWRGKIKDGSGVNLNASTEDASNTVSASTTDPKKLNVTGIGDSLMSGLASIFTDSFSFFNGTWKIGAQFSEGLSYAQNLNSKSEIKDYVVMTLGTNGPVSETDFDNMMNTLGVNRKVFLANNYADNSANLNYIETNNQLFETMASKYSNLQIINWSNYAKNHSAEIASDGVHPTSTGYSSLAKLFLDAIKSYSKTNDDNNRCESDAKDAGDLISLAKKFAWPLACSPGTSIVIGNDECHANRPRPSYEKAIEKAKADKRWVNSEGNGQDCGVFTTTLLVDSGFEPDYNNDFKELAGSNGTVAGNQFPWVSRQVKAGKWKFLNLPDPNSMNPTVIDTNELEPGDVAFNTTLGHTFIYVGDDVFKPYQLNGETIKKVAASASYRERYPMAAPENLSVCVSCGETPIIWARKVK